MACDREAVQRLAEQRGCCLESLEKVLRCAFLMSEKNQGAIFVMGDADTVLGRSDSSELGSYATIASTNVRDLTDRELINFAKQDGATVIDPDGRFRGCMVLLRPSADTKADIGLGKGARHSSAAKISAEAHALAIAVSQDGPITVYDNGRRVLSL
jgi:DNA integrity scanning protein DisA with diadenylate cyclase activity